MGRTTGLPEALRRARLTRGWTQADLGRQVGVTQGAVSLWEHGAETPSFVHMLKLLVALPELRASLPADQIDLLVRVERAVFAERCTCGDCSCHAHAPLPLA